MLRFVRFFAKLPSFCTAQAIAVVAALALTVSAAGNLAWLLQFLHANASLDVVLHELLLLAEEVDRHSRGPVRAPRAA